ncbi:hypothetical protein CAC42_3189 [Sphaceloma murrayae]|uniref:Uncharacterized protein n=1 Tax=Sphaceloma murrayae TaxID=2082308 RepID=A0A2K1QRU0_9PEZI|nr:hypothetical protein CAC42_3189 [Sphaceloma murrayae]
MNEGGSTQPKRYRSPCLALINMRQDEYVRFDQFVDEVVSQHSEQFATKCFEDEHVFQQEALRLLCKLYRERPPNDENLHLMLHQALRLLVVTRIMSNVISIPLDHFRSIAPQLSQIAQPQDYGAFVVPRVAAYQLKYYFSQIRNEAYIKVLKYMHGRFRAGEDKKATWIIMFCLVLVMAMVLEDCQQLIHIRGEARINRGQKEAFTARTEAALECRNIDNQFGFLVNIFHCKYRKKNAQFARLSDYTASRPQDGPEITFIHGLQNLMAQEAEYLREQNNVVIPPSNITKYTSRLIARFLDNFMGLQLGSQGRDA